MNEAEELIAELERVRLAERVRQDREDDGRRPGSRVHGRTPGRAYADAEIWGSRGWPIICWSGSR